VGGRFDWLQQVEQGFDACGQDGVDRAFDTDHDDRAAARVGQVNEQWRGSVQRVGEPAVG
jgi:hypothetical protein